MKKLVRVSTLIISTGIILIYGIKLSQVFAGHVPNRDWQALARQDLADMYIQILENHPGAIDPQNPTLRAKSKRILCTSPGSFASST